MSPSGTTILIFVVLVLLMMTALTAGAETAYFSLSAKDINFLKTKEKASARTASQLLEQPKKLLATILVANNFINIAIVITTDMLVNSMIHSMFPEAHPEGIVTFLIQVVSVTFLLVLFGEVLPKVYATQNNLRMALFSAPFLQGLTWLFGPVSRILVSSTRFIEGKIGTKASNISSEDFEHAIELTVGHTATREEVNIFKGILKFGNITARQAMRTRLDVSGLDHDMSFPEVRKYCIEVGYSRLPVYKDNLDTIAGMIHTKDLLPHIDNDELDWHTLMRPAFFVHESKLIEDLLKEFQQKRQHFAIVVDEFGGTSGIITLEDIMEEIIGDIKDEFDEDDLHYKKIDDRNFIFEGKTLINDVCRVIGLPSDEFDKARGESDSLAGLVLEIAGKFVSVNEVISYQQYDFTVMAVEKMRITRVKLTIVPPKAEDGDEETS
ncbi:gliding motility-associated protein GldE [Nemorincola caseinilytica]|uniref:Gliding motility-associated protein GldE n=1 Tax=Nemorincola caseinilytica TaxID=2054315 RepID=A0ABP8N5C0_9BACT